MHNWYDVLKEFAAPVVALLGLAITRGLGVFGLRSFGRWKREQIEERKIEVAVEALAYESKYVFDYIRSSLGFEAEWADMEHVEGDDEKEE